MDNQQNMAAGFTLTLNLVSLMNLIVNVGPTIPHFLHHWQPLQWLQNLYIECECTRTWSIAPMPKSSKKYQLYCYILELSAPPIAQRHLQITRLHQKCWTKLSPVNLGRPHSFESKSHWKQSIPFTERCAVYIWRSPYRCHLNSFDLKLTQSLDRSRVARVAQALSLMQTLTGQVSNVRSGHVQLKALALHLGYHFYSFTCAILFFFIKASDIMCLLPHFPLHLSFLWFKINYTGLCLQKQLLRSPCLPYSGSYIIHPAFSAWDTLSL